MENILEFFYLETLKTTFWMKKLTLDLHNQGLSLQNQDTFIDFQMGQGHLPSRPSCTPTSVAEYASISLNRPKYPWKCLNELFWLCQGFEHTWSSYILDRILKTLRVLNKQGVWIRHGCIFTRYTEFRICLIMAPYASIMPEYASICLNMAEYCWMSLNMPE